MKEKESEYVEKFAKVANEFFKETKYKIFVGENLFYELGLDLRNELSIENINKAKRGRSAFQTDICIFEEKDNSKVPRVVIEFKLNPSTHDIIIYSAKAAKHKQIYPWLRYGMIVCELDNLPIKKFTTHNDFMDFLVGSKKYFEGNSGNILTEFSAKLIQSEIKMSETLESIYFKNPKSNFFQKRIIFEDM